MMKIEGIVSQIQGGKSLLCLQDFVQSKNDIRFAETIVAISKQEQIFTKEKLKNALWEKVIGLYEQIEKTNHQRALEYVTKGNCKKEYFSNFTSLFNYVWNSCGYTINGKTYNKTPIKIIVWKNQKHLRKFFNNNISFFFLLVLFQLAVRSIEYLFPELLSLDDFNATWEYALFLMIFFPCGFFIVGLWGEDKTKSTSIALSLLFVLCPPVCYIIFSDKLVAQYLAQLFITRAVCGLLFLPIMFINSERISEQQTDEDNELNNPWWIIFWFICSILLASGIWNITFVITFVVGVIISIAYLLIGCFGLFILNYIVYIIVKMLKNLVSYIRIKNSSHVE